MFAIACNLCDRAIREEAYVCDLVHGRIVVDEGTALRLGHGQGSLSLYLCVKCARRIRKLMLMIRQEADNEAQAG